MVFSGGTRLAGARAARAQSRSTRQLKRPPPTDMGYLISLLLILPCAGARAYPSAHKYAGANAYQSASAYQDANAYSSANAYPNAASALGVGRLIQLRRNAYPLYATDSSGEEYEPYAVAALPLHQPVPILQVLSPTTYRSKLRRPVRRPRPETADLYAFDASQIEHAYEPVEYEAVYASSEESSPKYAKVRDQYEDEASSVVVYARPNRVGGFSYRKPQVASSTTAAPTSVPAPAQRPREPQQPVIIRIHKYRVVH